MSSRKRPGKRAPSGAPGNTTPTATTAYLTVEQLVTHRQLLKQRDEAQGALDGFSIWMSHAHNMPPNSRFRDDGLGFEAPGKGVKAIAIPPVPVSEEQEKPKPPKPAKPKPHSAAAGATV